MLQAGAVVWVLTASVVVAAAEPPTVYLNANIRTMNPAQPRAEAMAARDGILLAVGSSDEVLAAAREGDLEPTIVDLRGRTVLPGLIDAHGHMTGLGALAHGVLDLSSARSFDEVVQAVARAAERTPPGEWILGARWDHESWADRALPTHTLLSQRVPHHPVWLRRVDGHAGLANARAMELAGIAPQTPDPPGGEIMRNADGEPTGLLIDNAMHLIEQRIPPEARGRPEDLILKAQELCLAAGLTGVHDAGVSPAEIELYQQLERDGRLKLRIYAMVSAPYAMRWFEEHGIYEGERLTVRAAKLYMDGAMGSRGAWLLEPYSDRPTGPDGTPYTGLAVSTPQFIEEVARHALRHGYQVCTHAIGDRANREVLDAYVRAIQAHVHGTIPEHRFRIEHAQLLAPSDIPRFAAWRVIASMQPTHCTSDMRWVEARVGRERAAGAYAWASLLFSGAIIAGGSDFPVESHNPFLGIYAAVTRQDLEGRPEGGWFPRERVLRGDALQMFTRHAAYAAFQEHRLGSLEKGKAADFIVVDRDVMTCPERDIPATRVLRTVIAGETVYQSAP